MKGAIIGLACLLVSSSVLAADDPFVGTWKYNPAKSHVGNAPGDPVSATLVIQLTAPHEYKLIGDETLRSGKNEHYERTRTFDGKSRPARGSGYGHRPGGITTATMDSPSKRHWFATRNGKAIARVTESVSADGKTLTITDNLERLPDGSTEFDVWDRQ